MLLRLLRDLIGGWKTPEEDLMLGLAREHLNQFRNVEAVEVLTGLLERKPDCLEALILRGTVKREIGRPMEAAVDLARAAALAPNDHRCLYELALVSYTLGDTRLALEYCERLRRVAPEMNAACMRQAQIQLGSENNFQILTRILDFVKPRTCVKIGVAQGDSLRLVKPPTLVIGIDPYPQLAGPLVGNLKVFAETRDAFFASRDLHAEIGRLAVDLAIIDGMHHFEFALRDFANLERHCARDSTNLVHDCHPLDRETAERDQHSVFWSGDIWRLVVLLRKYRPELAVHTIGTPPTGLRLVRNLDPGSCFLLEHYDRLYEEFLSLDHSCLDQDMAVKLSLFPNEWGKIRAPPDRPRAAGTAPR
jgi:tetratricopeptide (TPR) repeat protein